MNNRTAAAEQLETTYRKEPKLLTSGSFTAPRLLSSTTAQPTETIEPIEPFQPIDAEMIESSASTDPNTVTVKILGTLPSALLPSAAADNPPPHKQGLLLNGRPVCPQCGMAPIKKKRQLCAGCNLIRVVGEMIAEGVITEAAWRNLRAGLELPVELREMRDKQLGILRPLLQYFAAHCPIAEQENLSPDEVRVWLRDHLPPVLKKQSKVFTFSVPKADFIEAAKNKENSGRKDNQPGAEADYSGTSVNEPIDEEIKQDDEPQPLPQPPRRVAISPAKFTQVAVRQGSFCFWCGIRVVRESQIPPRNRYLKENWMLVYLSEDGVLREEAVGTIDHLVRVADGGNNKTANLVISCYPCNIERDERTQGYASPFARRRIPCGNCGGRFFHPDWGCCSICGAPPDRTSQECESENPKNSGWRERIGRLLKLVGRLTGRWLK